MRGSGQRSAVSNQHSAIAARPSHGSETNACGFIQKLSNDS